MMRLLANEEVYDAVIEEGMTQAKHSVWIATANVKNLMLSVSDIFVESSMNLFEELVSKNVSVRLLHSGVPSESFLRELKEKKTILAGNPHFEMRRCMRIHFKCVLIDNKFLYIGSANFTGAGLGMQGKTRRNFELGMVMDDDSYMDRVASLYDEIWTGAHCKKCGRKKNCVIPLESPY